MAAEQQQTANEEEQESVKAGTILKNKREELGLTQRQIADRLRLRLSIIENIENNNFSSEQVATFTRGYLRSYARAVGLEPTQVLEALEQSQKEQPEDQNMKSFSRKTKREAHDSRIMNITWFILLVIVGISSVLWWQNREVTMADFTADDVSDFPESSTNAEQPPLDFSTITETRVEPVIDEMPVEDEQVKTEVPAENNQKTAVVKEKVVEAETTVEVQKVTREPQQLEVTQSNAQSESIEQQVTEQQNVTEIDNKGQLVMSFDNDCWIQIKDSTGKTLSTGVKKAGQSITLSGTLPYSVILGAPENVSMTLSSEPIDLSGYTSGKVARFNLP